MIVFTAYIPCLLSGLVQCRKQHTGKDGDDSDNYEQFDQGEKREGLFLYGSEMIIPVFHNSSLYLVLKIIEKVIPKSKYKQNRGKCKMLSGGLWLFFCDIKYQKKHKKNALINKKQVRYTIFRYREREYKYQPKDTILSGFIRLKKGRSGRDFAGCFYKGFPVFSRRHPGKTAEEPQEIFFVFEVGHFGDLGKGGIHIGPDQCLAEIQPGFGNKF